MSLQWRDVDLERGELTIRAEKAKDGDTRVLPMSSRLKAVLKMAQTDPAGNNYPAEAFVFGELGEQTKNISRGARACAKPTATNPNGHPRRYYRPRPWRH